jgi:hypothetical protein
MTIKLATLVLLSLPILLPAQIQIMSNLEWKVGTEPNGPFDSPVYDVSDCTDEAYIDAICGPDYPSPLLSEHFADCPDMIPIWGQASPTSCNYPAVTNYWFHHSFDLDITNEFCNWSGTAYIQADQSFTLFINDNIVASSTDSDWPTLFSYDVSDLLNDGANDIRIRANNLDGGSCFNYAFLAFCLTIDTLPKPEVEAGFLDGNVVFAIGIYDSYQWVDCDQNFEAIPGATNNYFDPSESGNYALVATIGFCVDTSNCGPVVPSSVTSDLPGNTDNCVHLIHPNPSPSGSILLDIRESIGDTEVAIYTRTGQLVFSQTFAAAPLAEIQLPEAAGIYFVVVTSSAGNCVVRVARFRE